MKSSTKQKRSLAKGLNPTIQQSSNPIINKQDDEAFDALYDPRFRAQSNVHWTPIAVGRTVVEWLNLDEHSRVLDIGSGVGKFCAVASSISEAKFMGVEIRRNLHEEAERFAQQFDLKNVEYVNADITTIDFRDYTGFYFYNPFCEQLATSDWIDHALDFSDENYYAYQNYVLEQFEHLPIGTRIVTYCSEDLIFSYNFRLHQLSDDGQLQLWVKER